MNAILTVELGGVRHIADDGILTWLMLDGRNIDRVRLTLGIVRLGGIPRGIHVHLKGLVSIPLSIYKERKGTAT
jgi:hypothetical protein